MVESIHHRRYVVLRQHIKQLRKSAGLTQAQLAEKLGQDQSYVSKIERGERYVDVLLYIDWCFACGFQPAQKIQILETTDFLNLK
ncbi:helix-turn-helix domain-containing protein [Xylophilus ampelinus]|uniref:helix-turn-helix domain-containing protein n=1 Tax=Xylophilus ampelinus TaxID=54067 RepID=UPI000D7CDAA6|nr:helix-turn-helix transcriptional regulator [Xylophilus ampelinus]MCS4510381.1 helix-turn-helix transcriptional regulator [Xylophilus ampelinus]